MNKNFTLIKKEIIEKVNGRWNGDYIDVDKEVNRLGDRSIMFYKYYNEKTIKIRLYCYGEYLNELNEVCNNNLDKIKWYKESWDGNFRPCYDIMIYR